ncbi:MAG TPA: phosphohistidine phosphatase SixA [Chloroflexota bacterium]|nr:phosphohistidine phosphatase SixA [Chloroflexota bacterium]
MLYLVRHGKAEEGLYDDARRLTAGGRKAVRRAAERLAAAGVTVDRIEHSGLTRAQETAEILADLLGGELNAVSGLRPGDDVRPMAQWLAAEADGNVMLVGHLPFMERLVSYLLTGDADAAAVHFRTATIAALELQGGSWALEWLLPPRLL